MALLEFVLILLLHAEGVSGGRIDLYNKPGDEVVLPCNSDVPSFTCSIVNWLYYRDQKSALKWEVIEGHVKKNSARAARLSVNSDCSLTIKNITDEDVGFYTCRLGEKSHHDASVFLNILTVSPSPPDADLQKDEVTLTSEEGNSVTIQAHYTPDSPGSQIPKSQQTIIIIVGAVVGVMLLFFIITVVIIKCRWRTKETEDQRITNVQTPDDETENNVTYATVDHAHPKVSSKKKVKEEEDVVTYSAVRTKTDAEVDNDPSSYYSCVNLPE